MKRALPLLLLVSMLGCARVPEHDPDQWPLSRIDLVREIPSADPAELTYRGHCLPCHGVDGRGAGAVTGADFTSAIEGPLLRPDTELLTSIREGRRGTIGVMPAHREILSDDEIVAVLAYVRRAFGPTIVPVVPAEVPDVDAGP